MTDKGTVLCIVGPTASGKTAISIDIALQCNGEIVSADAVAVYRGLDIGSAKPTIAERKGIMHHMIDCVEITDPDFSVSRFRELARNSINEILARNKLPIVVGGSGLYLDSVFADMSFSAPSDPVIRRDVESAYDVNPEGLFALLRRMDPDTADRLHPNDKKRVVRAVEVIRLTGKPFSELNRDFEEAQHNDGTYRTVKVGIYMPREILYQRINDRVDQMIKLGFKQEAYALFDRGLTPDCYTAMHSIGYTQLFDAYRGCCSDEEAIEEIKRATRRFAKRQLTWFRRDRNTVWFDYSKQDYQQIIHSIMEML